MTTRYATDIPLEALPESWQKHVTRLRRESSRHRQERNAAREEADRLRAALASETLRFEAQITDLSRELAELKAAAR